MLPTASITIGGGQEEQHLLAFPELHTGYLDGPRRRAEERLHGRLESEHFLECGSRLQGILSEALPLIRMLCEAEHGIAKPDDCRVEPRRQERSHEQRCLFLGELAAVRRGVDLGTEAAGREGA